MNNIVLFMISAWLGVSLFFSFDVAPILFDTISPFLAGEVVSKIFPIYFGTGLFIFIFSILLLLKEKNTLNKLLLFFILNIIIFLAFIFYILPEAQILKHTNYNSFLRLHAFSMILNIVQIISSFIITVKLL